MLNSFQTIHNVILPSIVWKLKSMTVHVCYDSLCSSPFQFSSPHDFYILYLRYLTITTRITTWGIWDWSRTWRTWAYRASYDVQKKERNIRIMKMHLDLLTAIKLAHSVIVFITIFILNAVIICRDKNYSSWLWSHFETLVVIVICQSYFHVWLESKTASICMLHKTIAIVGYISTSITSKFSVICSEFSIQPKVIPWKIDFI